MINIRKYFGEPMNIYESLSPFYYFLKLFGLASYSLNFKNGRMKTSFTSYIMFLIYIILYIILNVNFLNIDIDQYSPVGRSIVIYGYRFIYIFQYLAILLVIIYNFLKRRNIEKFLKLMETFDDHTDKMGWKFKINHERNYWTSIFWIFLHFILLCTVYFLRMYWVQDSEPILEEFINMFCYCIITNTYIWCSLQFIFGAQCVESRFEILNKNAR